MTFEDALAQQPAWLQIWLNVLFVGAFVLPLTLLIWRETRVAGAITVLVTVVAGLAVTWLYARMGYVRLLGLPHLILWIPLVIYLWRVQDRDSVRDWPRRIIWGVMAVICVSLAFDIVDVLRWVLGERAPTILPA